MKEGIILEELGALFRSRHARLPKCCHIDTIILMLRVNLVSLKFKIVITTSSSNECDPRPYHTRVLLSRRGSQLEALAGERSEMSKFRVSS